jgi:hypothetical protein
MISRISILVVMLLASFAIPAGAQTALKNIDNPSGGKIVYGLVDGASSEAGAMGIILSSLHGQYGDKPQVGKVFQVRDSNSVAVFFTLGRLEAQDGKGKMVFNTVFCSGGLSPMGQYPNVAFHTAVPEAIAAQQAATMGAIMNSFQVNTNVVNCQAAALAAPAIEQIHAIGRAAAAQAQQAHAWNQTADALVKGNPSRFGYVDTPNFWKGVDY